MDDARNLQYGIGFDTADAETSVENLGEKVETLEENIGAVEVGAQQMGASAVSACQMGQGAAERFTGAVGDASGGLDDMASSASEAGNAAQKAAGHWNMTAEGLKWVEEAAQAAEAAAESFRDEMDDSGGAAGRFRAQIKKTAESAQDMGPAFKGAMADGLDAGQSIAKSFRTGVTGAMDFTKKRAEIFANNMVRNAKNISKAFQHPIKIIRSGGQPAAPAGRQCAERGALWHVPRHHHSPGPEEQGRGGAGSAELCSQLRMQLPAGDRVSLRRHPHHPADGADLLRGSRSVPCYTRSTGNCRN